MKVAWKETKVQQEGRELRQFRLDLTHRLVLLVMEVPTTRAKDICWTWCLTQSVQGDDRSFHDDLIIQTLRETDPERAKEEALQESRAFFRQCLERVGG